MNGLLDILWPKDWIAKGCAILTGVAVIFIGRKIKQWDKRRKLREKWNNVGHDVVLLHQFARGKYCLNLSPYALKVETFLRLAKIEYIVDKDSPFGPIKKKCPWITLNGEDIEDSEDIIQFLKHKFNANIDSELDKRTIAKLEAVRIMADEHIFWCVITWRYWLDRCKSFLMSQSFSRYLNFMFPIFMSPGIKKRAIWHGIGVHSPETIFQITKRACHTLSDLLGDDLYFGGDKPCSADCSVFGQLSQLMWNAPESQYEQLVRDTYPSLAAYCDRMKSTIFPDWNKLLNPPLE